MRAWDVLAGRAMGACLRAFGQPVLYAPAEQEPVEITAIFDAAYRAAETTPGGPSVMTVRPALTVRDADLPAPAGQGDTVTVVGQVYTVQVVMPDGAGNTTCILQAGLKTRW